MVRVQCQLPDPPAVIVVLFVELVTGEGGGVMPVTATATRDLCRWVQGLVCLCQK